MKKYLPGIIFIVGIFALFTILNVLLLTDEGTLYREKDFITFENVLYTPEELDSITDGPEAVTGVEHSYWEETEFSRVRTV